MNRLVIIGNGFDLAHGLKTRYEDFIVDLIKKSIIGKINDKNYEDAIIKVQYGRSNIRDICKEIEKLNSLNDILTSSLIDSREKDKNKNGWSSGFIGGFNSYNYEEKKPIFIYYSNFIQGLLQSKNWTDIENYYYKKLLDLFKEYNNIQTGYSLEEFQEKIIEKVKELNEEFDLLKNKLVEYLITIDEKTKITSDAFDEFSKIFSENLISDDNLERFKKTFESSKLGKIENIYFLNFNYTNTLSKYLEQIKIDKERYTEIKIHGSIDHPETIIFGYGDEKHKSYQEIEDINKNEFFTHIKSFGYFQNDEYQKLISFIKSGLDYEVYVLGHSLGLSDRTMLSTIFNAKNLTQIRLFYFENDGKDDYIEKSFELARHFNNKENMREKIVSKKLSTKMPKLNIDTSPKKSAIQKSNNLIIQ